MALMLKHILCSALRKVRMYVHIKKHSQTVLKLIWIEF
jgi:hypothetical protein